MAFGVPWAVSGGAENSTDVARVLAYNAARGNEGIIGATDLEVRELDVPGTSIRVIPGSCNILNRTAGYTNQMYTDRSPDVIELPIPPTGSGETRSDLIVARIEDPNVDPQWPVPADPAVGPYTHIRRISTGVTTGTTTVTELGLGYSAIALARIDIPAQTGTITQDMIMDLRTVANPRRERILRTFAVTVNDAEDLIQTDPAGRYWPNPGVWEIRVPEWATEAHVVAQWVGVRAPVEQTQARVWVGIGETTNQNDVATQEVLVDTPASAGVTRQVLVAADDVSVPAAHRGDVKTIGLRARKVSGGILEMDSGAAGILDIEFHETPTTDETYL